MKDGNELTGDEITQTTISIHGVRAHREFGANITFFGPPPFNLDTATFPDGSVTAEINGKPARVRFLLEVEQ